MPSHGMISVLHVLAPGGAGGLESTVRMLAASQAGAGHDVRVAAVVTERGGDACLESLARDGVRLQPFVVGRRAYLAERSRIRGLCGEEEPDVLHTHGYRPDLVAGPVGRRLGIPTVTTVHGFTGGGWKNRFYQWLQRRAFRRFDAVVAVSDPLAAELLRDGVRGERLHVIRNAWRPGEDLLDRHRAREALGLAEEAFVLGWVGRLSREKGPDVFLRAVSRLGVLPSVASMIGDGPERRHLRAGDPDGAGDARVRWHGSVPDAARLYRAFDVFVLSSRTEGTPIVLFEAMAAGVPIVAAAVGGVPDVLSPQEAILVPPEDPSALAAAVRRVHRHPEAARRRAEAAARRLREEFDPAAWVRRYDEVYRSLVSALTPSRPERHGTPGSGK